MEIEDTIINITCFYRIIVLVYDYMIVMVCHDYMYSIVVVFICILLRFSALFFLRHSHDDTVASRTRRSFFTNINTQLSSKLTSQNRTKSNGCI